MSRPAPFILESIERWATATPTQEAVVFLKSDGALERSTYAELQRKVALRAVVFENLAPASRVGLVAPHGPQFLVDALAILAAGHCLVPIHGGLSAADRAELEERAGIHAAWENEALALFPGEPIDSAEDADYRAIGPAYLRFTSGSTGRRKGVLLGHATIMERTEAANARLKIGPADRVLCLLPMVDHFVVSILLYLRFGATILLSERDEDAPALAQSEKATVLYGSPRHFALFQAALPAARLAVSTTQGLSEAVARRFLENTGCALSQALGIIEAGLLTLNDARAATEPMLAGQPMPAYQISVFRKGDERSGEIRVAGPGLLDAYLAPWRPRAVLLEAGGFSTGDHGWIDETSCLHLVGREKNRLEIAGSVFFSEELEAAINEHPDVLESLVFLKNDRLTVQVAAKNDPKLAAWILEKLPADSAPPEIQFVTELPRTPTGKIARP